MTRSSTASQQITRDLPAGLHGARLLAFLGVCLAALALAVVPASALAATSVSGTVTDADGHPITSQDICVVPYNHLPFQPPGLFAPTGTHAVTGPDGSWSLSSLAAGTYKFRAQDCEGSPRNDLPTFYGVGSGEEITLSGGAEVTGVDIALALATSISGRVYDGPGTAAPLEGICVDAFNDLGFRHARAQTDAVGSYVLRHLDPATTYTISFGPCNISPLVTEYAFWTENYGGVAPTILAPTVAQPLTGIDGHLTPVLSIAGGPGSGLVTTATSAVFQFAANVHALGPDATFLCALDGAPLAACDATYLVAGLSAGGHTLHVQARNGNLHTPVRTVSWTVSPGPQQAQGPPSTPKPPNAPAPAGQVGSVAAAKAAPTFKLTPPFKWRLRTLVRSGLPLTSSCSRACRVSVAVYMPASVARALKLAKHERRVGVVSARLASKPKKLVVRLTANTRSALARFDRALTLTLRITTKGTSGRPSVTTRSLRITP